MACELNEWMGQTTHHGLLPLVTVQLSMTGSFATGQGRFHVHLPDERAICHKLQAKQHFPNGTLRRQQTGFETVLILTRESEFKKCTRKPTICTRPRSFDTCLGQWASANFHSRTKYQGW